MTMRVRPVSTRRAWRAGLAAVAALAGCTVTESHRVTMAPGEASHAPSCSSETGSYSLSMTTWSFEIATYADSPYVLEEIREKRYPDPGHTYCLDYLASTLAHDRLAVGYTTTASTAATATGGGLLSYVASFAVDKTAVVIRQLIRAIFIGISGRADFSFARSGLDKNKRVLHGRFEVDPLDAEEMAQLNRRLGDFGFCLVLAGYSVDAAVSGKDYCNAPERRLRQAPSPLLEMARAQSWLVEQPERAGVLYRPRIPYSLEIYTQDDPGHSAWELRKVTEVRLENLAPIVSLGINRAIFADAKVGLEFDGGVLKNYCVSKTSEVAGFIDIPLDIVYGIVSLPGQTLKAEFDRVNATRDLVAAETALIKTQREYEAFLRNKNAGTAGVGNPPAKLSNTDACANKACEFTGAIPAEQTIAKSAGAFLLEGTSGVCTNSKTALVRADGDPQ